MSLSTSIRRGPKYVRLVLGLLTVGVLQALFINASPNPANNSNHSVVAEQILVQPKAGVTKDKLDQILAVHGGKSLRALNQIGVHVVKVPRGSEKAIANALAKNSDIKFAEVDELVPVSMIPDDPYFGSQWHLSVINAPAAWDVSQGDGIVIAILDSGVDGTHPDLSGKMVAGYNFYDNNTDTRDVMGHGTKVAGSAAASSNNAVGVTGVSMNSRIMPIRISDTSGWAMWSTIASGINWAADHGARIVNISYQAHQSSTIQSASQYLKNKGGLVVNSAGNTSALDSTPASDTMITVSATNGSDSRTSWSSFGPYVDLAAPGEGIYTTVAGGGYGGVSGTSFSSPITAGVVALMMSANPGLSSNQIMNILFETAVDIGDIGWDQYYGYGRIDAAAAVRAAASAVITDTLAPTVSISSPTNGSVVKDTISISVNSSDNYGVSRIELFVNGSLVGTDTIPPYSFSLDTKAFADGNLVLMAKSIDAAGNSATSSITVSVRNTIDVTAPIVRISNPINGAVVNKGNVSVNATATDNIGVVSMIVYVDGLQKASSASGSVSYSINASKLSTGFHVIKVDAKDSSGNTGTNSVQIKK